MHKVFVFPGVTENSQYNHNVLDQLLKHITNFVIVRDFFIFHNNALAHPARINQRLLANRRLPTIIHMLYYPDLSPPDYSALPKVKM